MSQNLDDGASDAQVIEASLSDSEQFRVIFERYYDVIYRYLVRRGGIEVGAEAASETFVVAFSHRKRYDTAYRSAKPWLFGIASNLLRNQLRRDAVRRTKPLPTNSDTGEFVDDVAWRTDAQRLVQKAGLVAAIDALRPDEREILFLYAFGDLTYTEIAQIVDCPVGTVRSRLSRLRQRLFVPLREALSEEPP
ncbi:MAG: RNA polymerase sigma factor [Acidimicrobiia bacterium]